MKDTELIKRHDVKGTPFVIVETKEHGVFIHLGMYRVSKTYRTVSECRTVIKARPWELLISVMYACAHETLNGKNPADYGKKQSQTQLPNGQIQMPQPDKNNGN